MKKQKRYRLVFSVSEPVYRKLDREARMWNKQYDLKGKDAYTPAKIAALRLIIGG
jgi:hypothetical protein